MASDSAPFMRDCIQKIPTQKWAAAFWYSKSQQSFVFFLEGHFSLTSTHFVSREKTRIKAREVP